MGKTPGPRPRRRAPGGRAGRCPIPGSAPRRSQVGVGRAPRPFPARRVGTEPGRRRRLRPHPAPGGPGLLATGGGKGIGAECALALARRYGARLALLGRSRPERDPELARNLKRLEALSHPCCYLRADVGDAEAVRAAVKRATAQLGPVRAFLHGAGTNRPKLAGSLSRADVERTLEPKVTGLGSRPRGRRHRKAEAPGGLRIDHQPHGPRRRSRLCPRRRGFEADDRRLRGRASVVPVAVSRMVGVVGGRDGGPSGGFRGAGPPGDHSDPAGCGSRHAARAARAADADRPFPPHPRLSPAVRHRMSGGDRARRPGGLVRFFVAGRARARRPRSPRRLHPRSPGLYPSLHSASGGCGSPGVRTGSGHGELRNPQRDGGRATTPGPDPDLRPGDPQPGRRASATNSWRSWRRKPAKTTTPSRPACGR